MVPEGNAVAGLHFANWMDCD